MSPRLQGLVIQSINHPGLDFLSFLYDLVRIFLLVPVAPKYANEVVFQWVHDTSQAGNRMWKFPSDIGLEGKDDARLSGSDRAVEAR